MDAYPCTNRICPKNYGYRHGSENGGPWHCTLPSCPLSKVTLKGGPYAGQVVTWPWYKRTWRLWLRPISFSVFPVRRSDGMQVGFGMYDHRGGLIDCHDPLRFEAQT